MKKYCENCNKEVEYNILTEEIKFVICDKSVVINYESPRCLDCGRELNDNELFEKTCKLARDKYISQYNIISIEEIQDILDRHDVEATDLSLTLGWGKVTIFKYLNGKLPLKEHSDKLRQFDLIKEVK